MIKENWLDSIFSDGTKLFLSNTNPVIGEWVTIKIRVAAKSPVTKVYIRYACNGDEIVKQMEVCENDTLFSYYGHTVQMTQKTLLYRFILVTDSEVYFYNQKGIYEHACLETHDFKLLVNFDSPEWVTDSVFYQIFPDRFCNGNPSNDIQEDEYTVNGFSSVKKDWGSIPGEYADYGCLDYYGGDLEGIEQKIEYLKELGVNTIYLNPIFAAYSHHKYDCLDYFEVDRCFGGNETFEQLCKQLHAGGMKIILDISINHTGILHPWTKEKKEFYYTNEEGDFEYWLGVPDLPTLNYECEKLKEVIYKNPDSALKKWMKEPYNIDGWRFDVGQSVGKMKQSEIDQKIWREIRQELKQLNPHMYFLAEHWDDCVRYLQGDMWDSTMNYYGFARATRKYLGENDTYLNWKVQGLPIKKNNAFIFMAEVNEYLSSIPYQMQRIQMNLINSHDIHRFSSVADISEQNKKTAIVMLFTFVGVPSIYYGDEVGIGGRVGSDVGARYPMQWDESKWNHEMMELYKYMIQLRKDHEVLREGSFRLIEMQEDILCYTRFNREQAIIFINSQSKETKTFDINVNLIGEFLRVDILCGIGGSTYSFEENGLHIQVDSESTMLLKLY